MYGRAAGQQGGGGLWPGAEALGFCHDINGRQGMDRSVTPAERSDRDDRKSDRKVWSPPEVSDLPRLTDLTLLTGSPIPGGGGTGGGGSTVF